MNAVLELPSAIAKKLNLPLDSVRKTLELLEGGATLPFIARYRKEVTGHMDEVQIGDIMDQKAFLEKMQVRKEYILKTLGELSIDDEALTHAISNCQSATELEDLFAPYKPKRRTKAQMAREKGLEPLAKQLIKGVRANEILQRYTTSKGLSEQEALAGAIEIMAEWFGERSFLKNRLRQLIRRYGQWKSKVVKGAEEKGKAYRDYFDFSASTGKMPGFRWLALERAEAEKIIRLQLHIPKEHGEFTVVKSAVGNSLDPDGYIAKAATEAYKRFLKPSVESELRTSNKELADVEAIQIFSGNLKQLLLMPPLGARRVLAIDPGFVTGCKVVCIDSNGNLLHNTTLFPHPPQKEVTATKKKLAQWVQSYKIEAIAIGNGTAGRETERLVKSTSFDREVKAFVVSEDGASIYSASSVGRKEFPQYDVTVRGAVSIGRRLQDPLAEWVKIDPKSLGVGQYQHDVNQKQLQEALDRVVVSCVNQVGVEVNTASEYLLKYVSGVGPKLAANIVKYRSENGAFTSRESLKKVPLLGPLAFEQAAGFIRISEGDNPLDNTGVHPENYSFVESVAKSHNQTVAELMEHLEDVKWPLDLVGETTLRDVVEDLKKPGRDPRNEISVFSFSEEFSTIEGLRVGAIIPGLVSNITRFGAFVDIGIKQHGLVHISQMANTFVSDPLQIVSLQQAVNVEVLEVDKDRNRIQLSMKNVKQPKRN